ncbi:MAG: pyridoxal-phosphate dependent enzyme [Acidimicrobiales bacterium]
MPNPPDPPDPPDPPFFGAGTAAALLPREVVDEEVYQRTVTRFRERAIALPRFSQLAHPTGEGSASVNQATDPDAADPANLFRVHWFNGLDRRTTVEVPCHLVLPQALTGVQAPVVVLLGRLFPLIRAHKVLAAYACLVPHVVTGGFDPTRQRAVWPSTGNYARGGVAISRLMDCHGVAVLPEGMSRERFEWLDRWVTDPNDVIRTPGTESNVKEIYDACHRLAADPLNRIFNQFSEYANHLAHLTVTGPALGRVFETLAEADPALRLAAFVSATGSAGTIAAGDHLKERYGSRTVAVEALECPTLLRNGYGSHNIQGIGDKHVPLIHNVMATDAVVAVSDRATDGLDLVCNSDPGRRYLADTLGVNAGLVAALSSLGLSSICNVLAAIRVARLWNLGPQDVVLTVATDGAELYGSERTKTLAADFPDGFDELDAARLVGRYLHGGAGVEALECTEADRQRIFNLGYFTWVEQQGVTLEHFDARRDQGFWRSLRGVVARWDELIDEFNARTGAAVPGPRPR